MIYWFLKYFKTILKSTRRCKMGNNFDKVFQTGTFSAIVSVCLDGKKEKLSQESKKRVSEAEKIYKEIEANPLPVFLSEEFLEFISKMNKMHTLLIEAQQFQLELKKLVK